MLAGDHVYKMDYELMLQQHVNSGADVTVGCLEVPRMEATGFGVMHVDDDDRIVSFLEKPADPPGMPGKPELALASMGIYVFRRQFLIEQLRRDAADPNSSRDFGKDIIPHLVKHGKAVAHRFARSCVRSSGQARAYWRDVGTLDAYWAANIDLTDVVPELDLYDRDWPIWTYARDHAAREIRARRRGPARHGRLVARVGRLHRFGLDAAAARCCSPACTCTPIRRGRARRDPARTSTSGRGARLTNVIVDRGVRIPAGLVVGEDPELDAQRFRRTERGICLITQPMIDRLGNDRLRSPCLSVGRRRGLSADQDRRPGRRRRRAARGARRRRRRNAHAAAGLSCGAGRAARCAAVYTFAALHGGSARVLAARVDNSDLFVLDAPHLYARDGGPYADADGAIGRTTRFASPRLRARPRPLAMAQWRSSSPMSCTRTTGRPAWRPPICTMAANRGRAP